MLHKATKDGKKKHYLERKENAMQSLICSGFLGCEFRMYYRSTNIEPQSVR